MTLKELNELNLDSKLALIGFIDSQKTSYSLSRDYINQMIKIKKYITSQLMAELMQIDVDKIQVEHEDSI